MLLARLMLDGLPPNFLALELPLPPDGADDATDGATAALDLLGPPNGRRVSDDLTAVALIVGVISDGVMIAGPFDDDFFFGLKTGRDLDVPNGRMTGVNFFGAFESSSSLFVSLIEPSMTAAVGLITEDFGDTTFAFEAVG